MTAGRSFRLVTLLLPVLAAGCTLGRATTRVTPGLSGSVGAAGVRALPGLPTYDNNSEPVGYRTVAHAGAQAGVAYGWARPDGGGTELALHLSLWTGPYPAMPAPSLEIFVAAAPRGRWQWGGGAELGLSPAGYGLATVQLGAGFELAGGLRLVLHGTDTSVFVPFVALGCQGARHGLSLVLALGHAPGGLDIEPCDPLSDCQESSQHVRRRNVGFVAAIARF